MGTLNIIGNGTLNRMSGGVFAPMLASVPEELPVGTAAYGGYVAGVIDTDAGTIEGGDAYQTGRRYMLIVAPKSLEATVTSSRQWASSNQNLAGTKSRWDGLSITEAMLTAGSQYEAAAYCNGLTYADDGGSQWYLPARDELELLYRNLKSGTGASAAGHGVNPSSDPTGAAYADGLPGQTSVTAFQSGNAEAFVLSTNQTYMSSTWSTSSQFWCQDFSDGWQFGIAQTTSSNMSIRPVRRVYLDEPLTTVGDIYVATTGNDTTGDGTPGNPFATIAKASTVVLPGNAVRVAPGTYTGQVTTNKSGLPDARIRYVSTTPRGAKIDANGANRAWVNGGAYINIEGFEITNSEYVGILNNSHSCIIRGNHIHSLTATDTNGGNGGAFYTEHATQSHDNWVDGNLCHGNSGMVEATHNHGIYIASPGGTATNNIVYDVAAIGLHAYHDPQGVIFANNLIFDCDQGILVGGDSGGNAVSDAVVNNNIVIDCRVGVQELPSPYTGAGNEYDSNIFFGYTLLSYKDGGSVPLTNTITSNPQLVNYQIDGSGDYHLTSGSPAIGEGTATGAPEKDYDGVTRGSPPDIGPYEYVA